MDGKIFTQFPKIQVFKGTPLAKTLSKDPFKVALENTNIPSVCNAQLWFQGHYSETPLELMVDLEGFNEQRVYLMEWEPFKQQWDNIIIESEK